jgi:glycerol dehydrogenase-like iron-containing ADH family enzyme
MTYDFDISGIVDAVGETVSIVSVSRSYSDRGKETQTNTSYSSKAVVQEMTADDFEVQEGIVQAGDITAFFDEDANNVAYLLNDNKITSVVSLGSTRTYLITNVIHNDGHYEVWASREA